MRWDFWTFKKRGTVRLFSVSWLRIFPTTWPGQTRMSSCKGSEWRWPSLKRGTSSSRLPKIERDIDKGWSLKQGSPGTRESEIWLSLCSGLNIYNGPDRETVEEGLQSLMKAEGFRVRQACVWILPLPPSGLSFLTCKIGTIPETADPFAAGWLVWVTGPQVDQSFLCPRVFGLVTK